MCNYCNDNPDQCPYASTCSVCHKKYFGNGYAETKLPCPECKHKQDAASIKPRLWYLVRKDHSVTPWVFNIWMNSFRTMSQANAYSELHGITDLYIPMRGMSIIDWQTDEAMNLAKLVYLSVPENKEQNGN